MAMANDNDANTIQKRHWMAANAAAADAWNMMANMNNPVIDNETPVARTGVGKISAVQVKEGPSMPAVQLMMYINERSRTYSFYFYEIEDLQDKNQEDKENSCTVSSMVVGSGVERDQDRFTYQTYYDAYVAHNYSN